MSNSKPTRRGTPIASSLRERLLRVIALYGVHAVRQDSGLSEAPFYKVLSPLNADIHHGTSIAVERTVERFEQRGAAKSA